MHTHKRTLTHSNAHSRARTNTHRYVVENAHVRYALTKNREPLAKGMTLWIDSASMGIAKLCFWEDKRSRPFWSRTTDMERVSRVLVRGPARVCSALFYSLL